MIEPLDYRCRLPGLMPVIQERSSRKANPPGMHALLEDGCRYSWWLAARCYAAAFTLLAK